jgi:hypothetical protein
MAEFYASFVQPERLDCTLCVWPSKGRCPGICQMRSPWLRGGLSHFSRASQAQVPGFLGEAPGLKRFES